MVLLTEQQESVGLQSPSEVPLEDRLDNMRGPYARIVPLFVEGSIQHADQVTNARLAERGKEDILEFRTNQSVGTADVALYVLEDGEPILYLGRGYDSGKLINPFLNSPNRIARFIERKQEATSKAVESGRWSKLERMDEEYHPTRAEAEAIKSANDTLRVRLSDVAINAIRVGYSEYRFADLEIDTGSNQGIERITSFGSPTRTAPLSDAQRAVAERVFGQGEDYQRNMTRLNSAGIKSVRLTFWYPGYVEVHAKKNPIANTCWISDANLNELNLHYDFHAAGSSTYGRLVGEPIVDYGPVRAMLLMSGDFSPESLGRRLSRRAAANIAGSLERFISDRGIGDNDHPNYWRHGWHLPHVEGVDYPLLARTLSSPEWAFRMDGNITSRMATNLFKALYNNAYSTGVGK